MKEFARTAKRAAITATIGLALAAATAGPAAASTESRAVYQGTYPNKSTCQRVGNWLAQEKDAPYSCVPHAGKWDLYIIYD